MLTIYDHNNEFIGIKENQKTTEISKYLSSATVRLHIFSWLENDP